MRNSMKVARWELKRNMKNKSFVISLLLTPLIFMVFFFVPSLFNKDSGSDGMPERLVHAYVLDELGLWDELEQVIEAELPHWMLERAALSEDEMHQLVAAEEQTIYIPLQAATLETGVLQLVVNEEADPSIAYEAELLYGPLRQLQWTQLGLSEEQKQQLQRGFTIEEVMLAAGTDSEGAVGDEAATDPLQRFAPGIFAGIILFSIVMTGMMIFTSASQEKKEKVAEIILSSLTPGELMQGKIIGYFILGITQVAVWMLFIIPLVVWKIGMPVLSYIFVPELIVLLFIAIAGYLLFASIFVAIGATVEDLSSTGNFQGIVMMLPFVPLLLISPVLSDPNGLIAKIGSFIPFTAPGVLLMRLTVLEEWAWLELGLALVVLALSIWVMMKLAGKIFKVGILMYGKNATPKEIWKWLWT